ncbi:unnamed protein product [Adineta ricciae]|uniref:Uncharacterized protein n=1 Tax=Adineta ricciae TaxID=249248 RepID=A0A815ZAV8_ADIRI|nr:unnamed protein product [Adineta ricciae]CAF1579946.1 unnamed protein product [Adineta ricciae]
MSTFVFSPHCFLLDGKHQSLLTLKSRDQLDKQSDCLSCQKSSQSELFVQTVRAINNNQDCQDEFCSSSSKSTRELVQNKRCSNQLSSRKIAITNAIHADGTQTHNSILRHKSLIDHLQQNKSCLLAMKSSRHLITFRDLRLRPTLPKRLLLNVEHSHPLLDIYRHRKNVNDETMCETD